MEQSTSKNNQNKPTFRGRLYFFCIFSNYF
nr:MAG TPA: hypothetical protein [Caudoviricetes sp.]